MSLTPLGVYAQGGEFDPFGYLTANLYAAYWPDDPAWTNPGNGGSITSARDGSGNGRNLVPGGGGATFTANALNGRAGYTFAGGTGRLRGSEAGWGNLAQPFTVIAVTLGHTSNDTLWASDENTAGKQVLFRQQALNNYQLFAGSSLVTANGLSTGARVTRAVVNGASSSFECYGLATASGAAGPGTLAGLRLGITYAATSPLQGSLGFVGVYSAAIDQATAADLVAALGSWYGITT